jgi:hypothetical protein
MLILTKEDGQRETPGSPTDAQDGACNAACICLPFDKRSIRLIVYRCACGAGVVCVYVCRGFLSWGAYVLLLSILQLHC